MEEKIKKCKTLKIKERTLKMITLMYIIVPVIIFLYGWTKLYISLPLIAVSIFIVIKNIKEQKQNDKIIEISIIGVIIAIFLAFIWCLLAGIGRLFYQPTYYLDLTIRNGICKDLVLKPWPVMYEEGTYMCYYIGQWILPTAIGKIFYYITGNEALAYNIGNVMLYIWCVIGVIIIFLWLIKMLKTTKTKKVILVLLTFILFSGLDVIGEYIVNRSPIFDMLLKEFEWWTRSQWQYSSFTSLLFWVFNQAIVPIQIILMIYDENERRNMGVLIIYGLLFGPYPMLGISVYILVNEIIACIKNKSLKNIKEYFSIQNILSIILILPIIILYYMANYKFFYRELDMTGEFNALLYLGFIIIEFLIYVVLIFNKKNMKELITISVFLMIIPIINGYDFVMRVSIPFILILYINIIKFLLDKTSNRIKKAIISILLLIATINPLAEMNGRIYKTVKSGYNSGAGVSEIPKLADFFKHSYVSANDTFFFKYIGRK